MMRPEDLREWRARLELTRRAAAAQLGLCERTLAYYEAGERPVPLVVELACRYLEMAAERAL